MNGKTFTLVKFRNMTNATDENGNLLPANQRVTKMGEFVRKTSLDELMNFWSVFKGDMSLIGPRPLATNYTSRFSERHKRRDAVRPGLECPFLTPSDHKRTWTEQFENDIYYVENLSFKLDVRMVIALFKAVFDRKSSSMRGAAPACAPRPAKPCPSKCGACTGNDPAGRSCGHAARTDGMARRLP